MSPIKDAAARRHYQREWIAQRRTEFFAGKACVDCGSTKQIRGAMLLVSAQTRGRGTDAPRDARPLGEGGRRDACKAAKSRRNKAYQESNTTSRPRNETHVQSPRPSSGLARTASGIIGVYYQPAASRSKPWRAVVGVDKRQTHRGTFASKDEAAAARRAAERDLKRS